MQQRLKTIRLIRLAIAAAVLLPGALFAFAAWTAYRNLHVLADERLLRSLDVLQEEAAKTFELTNLTMSNASDVVAGMSGEDIAQSGERLHGQFKKYSDAVAVIQSIWIYSADGRALVSSSVFPPPQQSYADRDFFDAHVKGNVGIYFGQVYPSSLNGGPFFTISRHFRTTVNSLACWWFPYCPATSLSSLRPWLTRAACNMPSFVRTASSLLAIPKCRLTR